jgi:hypothetical protein
MQITDVVFKKRSNPNTISSISCSLIDGIAVYDVVSLYPSGNLSRLNASRERSDL